MYLIAESIRWRIWITDNEETYKTIMTNRLSSLLIIQISQYPTNKETDCCDLFDHQLNTNNI